MKSIVSRAKRVQIFKWLLKKNNCVVELQKDFMFVHRKKVLTLNPVIIRDGKSFKLVVYYDPFSSSLAVQSLPTTITIPYKYNISYADVLDWILALMKKSHSSCYMMISWHEVEEFLKKDTTIEMLAIEFDLACRRALLSKSSKHEEMAH